MRPQTFLFGLGVVSTASAVATETGNGTAYSGAGLVGLGRTVFEPSCCYACLSSLWALQLPCTPAQYIELRVGNPPPCHARYPYYLNSLAYCMEVKCAADNTVSPAQVETCWNNVAGDGLPVPSLEAALPKVPPTHQLAYNATMLNTTMLVNDQMYEDSKRTIEAYVRQESAHARYGTVLIVTAIGVCFLIGFKRIINYYFPALGPPRFVSSLFSKYLFEPALIGSLHLKKFPLSIGYIPSRWLSLLILGYVALNAALCSVNYPTTTRNTWYLSEHKQQLSAVADRLGVLSFANIALTIMFSGRNSPLIYITGANRTDIITIHRWVSRVAALQGLIHVLLYWKNTNPAGWDMFTPAANIRVLAFTPGYWENGVYGIVGLSFVGFVFSILPLRTHLYEIFMFFHIGLAILTLYGIWWHVTYRFHHTYGYQTWLYIAFVMWGFDRVVRPIRIVLLNWKSWFVRSHPSAIVELLPGDQFIRVTAFPSRKWDFNSGQHCFLYFPTLLTNPLQSHPFSIAGWNHGTKYNSYPASESTSDFNLNPVEDDDDFIDLAAVTRPPKTYGGAPIELTRPGRRVASHYTKPVPSISFIIRPEKGLTRTLHKRLLKTRKARVPVIIEGPYGHTPTTTLHRSRTIIAIAGGIGITSILSHLQSYLESLGSKDEGQTTRFCLYWKAREESIVSAIESQLGDLEELRRKGVEINIFCSGQGQRMNARDVVMGEILSEAGAGRKTAVISCGPGAMSDGIRAAVVECIGKKGVSVEYIEEAFCW
ncbi:uncharacterized protein LY89DRAFT_717889 [Mollisia scopiformis]|uniref:FAD-binding FR-type domain-containing protein n=1 Tax=Mollisia scopiformis TaxID=149040 RepID=A0A194XDT6_MOLSC|nr:uncharacterized protein LY89DRAFT_717889 [Mollisia scopiformis]KUJ18314.1 hypothetical protein LY89DRAFT_717889 [Mollisia scopiformis]